MIKTFEFKLYPNKKQLAKLNTWLEVCCRVYNEALYQRTHNYKLYKLQIGRYDQQKLLTRWRASSPIIEDVPVNFERDALMRVDRSIKQFAKSCKKKDNKVGYPQKKLLKDYCSLESLEPRQYTSIENNTIFIPKLGEIKTRGRDFKLLENGKQFCLRVIKKAGEWYAQVSLNTLTDKSRLKTIIKNSIGIDVGLNSFTTNSNGEKTDNPRYYRKAQKKLAYHQKELARKEKCSKRKAKAVIKLQKIHQRIASQRKNFCHKLSTEIVKSNDLIVVENLNIQNMVKNPHLSKSIMDAGWGTFKRQLKYKAEEAGVYFIEVNPAYTSQECPSCGNVVPKKLSNRIHSCECGCNLDRDHAAGKVILERGIQEIKKKYPEVVINIKPVGRWVIALKIASNKAHGEAMAVSTLDEVRSPEIGHYRLCTSLTPKTK